MEIYRSTSSAPCARADGFTPRSTCPPTPPTCTPASATSRAPAPPRGHSPPRVDYDKGLPGITPPGDCLDRGLNDAPPLSQGRYYVGVFNAGPDLVKLHLIVEVQRALNPNRAQTIASDID